MNKKIPLQTYKVEAGFPSIAEEFIEDRIDLNKELIKHPASTFLVRVSGNSMIEAGIFHDDLLVVDKAIEAVSGKIVIAAIEGELTVKRLIIKNNIIYLKAENPEFPIIKLNSERGAYIWGVVINVIRSV